MKAASAFLALAWLAASTYAGYRLTARSFRWIDEPNFGLQAGANPASGAAPTMNLETLKNALPKAGQDPVSWFKSLSAEKQACLRRSISVERYQAAMRGEAIQPTPVEALLIANCLK